MGVGGREGRSNGSCKAGGAEGSGVGLCEWAWHLGVWREDAECGVGNGL